jgi:hypothetical protein
MISRCVVILPLHKCYHIDRSQSRSQSGLRPRSRASCLLLCPHETNVLYPALRSAENGVSMCVNNEKPARSGGTLVGYSSVGRLKITNNFTLNPTTRPKQK